MNKLRIDLDLEQRSGNLEFSYTLTINSVYFSHDSRVRNIRWNRLNPDWRRLFVHSPLSVSDAFEENPEDLHDPLEPGRLEASFAG